MGTERHCEDDRICIDMKSLHILTDQSQTLYRLHKQLVLDDSPQVNESIGILHVLRDTVRLHTTETKGPTVILNIRLCVSISIQ